RPGRSAEAAVGANTAVAAAPVAGAGYRRIAGLPPGAAVFTAGSTATASAPGHHQPRIMGGKAGARGHRGGTDGGAAAALSAADCEAASVERRWWWRTRAGAVGLRRA